MSPESPRAAAVFQRLAALSRKPARPPAVASQFWSDPYISDHILHAHLDPDSDAGSRPPERIREEVRWIIAHLGWSYLLRGAVKPPGPLVLDLGCGPGLYAKEFSRYGMRVVGMDFSPAAIDHARRINRRDKRCTFVHGDMTRKAYPTGIDGATMIYGTFGSLSDRGIGAVLQRLHRVLRPKGRFVFDLFGEEWARRHALSEQWYHVRKDGFWMPEGHFVLEGSWQYNAQQTIFNVYLLVDEHGGVQRQLVRHRWFSDEPLRALLAQHGFSLVQQVPVDADWRMVVAQKQPLP